MERLGLIFLKLYHKKGISVKVIIHKWKILPKNRHHMMSQANYQIPPEVKNSMDYQLTTRVSHIESWACKDLSQ